MINVIWQKAKSFYSFLINFIHLFIEKFDSITNKKRTNKKKKKNFYSPGGSIRLAVWLQFVIACVFG